MPSSLPDAQLLSSQHCGEIDPLAVQAEASAGGDEYLAWNG
jgi:hypothetical protein